MDYVKLRGYNAYFCYKFCNKEVDAHKYVVQCQNVEPAKHNDLQDHAVMPDIWDYITGLNNLAV